MAEKQWEELWFGVNCRLGAIIVYAVDEDQAITALVKKYGTVQGPYRVRWSREEPGEAFSGMNGGAFLDATADSPWLRSYPTGQPVLPMWMQLLVPPEEGGINLKGDSLSELLEKGLVALCPECGGYYYRGTGTYTIGRKSYSTPFNKCTHTG